MANEQVFALTQLTAMQATDRLPVQRALDDRLDSGTFALLGGLEVAAVVTADANQVGTAGELFRWDISGLTTANKTFTLPGSAGIQVGERVGLYIDTGDPDFEVEVRTNATEDTINGVDRSSASGPWVLLITGELLVLECVANGGAGLVEWVVVGDGRIPQLARGQWDGSLIVDHYTVAAWVNMPMDTEVFAVGAIVTTDVTSPETGANIKVRRDGKYMAAGSARFDNDQVAGILYLTRLAKDPQGTPVEIARLATNEASSTSVALDTGNAHAVVADLAAGDKINLQNFVGGGGNARDANNTVTFLAVVELL